MQKRIGLAFFSIIGSAMYTALALWGWGGVAGFFSNPARTAVIVVLFALAIMAAFTNSSGVGAGVREDKSNRWVLIPIISLGLFEAWLPAYMDKHNIWVQGGDVIRWTGVVLSAVGGVIRLVPVFELGPRFSGVVAIQEGHTLKTDGLYKTLRHPSYLGLLMVTFAWALAFRALLAGLIITAIMTIPIIIRMNSEENLLLDQFKDEYAEYKKRTWRLIPWVY